MSGDASPTSQKTSHPSVSCSRRAIARRRERGRHRAQHRDQQRQPVAAQAVQRLGRVQHGQGRGVAPTAGRCATCSRADGGDPRGPTARPSSRCRGRAAAASSITAQRGDLAAGVGAEEPPRVVGERQPDVDASSRAPTTRGRRRTLGLVRARSWSR